MDAFAALLVDRHFLGLAQCLFGEPRARDHNHSVLVLARYLVLSPQLAIQRSGCFVAGRVNARRLQRLLLALNLLFNRVHQLVEVELLDALELLNHLGLHIKDDQSKSIVFLQMLSEHLHHALLDGRHLVLAVGKTLIERGTDVQHDAQVDRFALHSLTLHAVIWLDIHHHIGFRLWWFSRSAAVHWRRHRARPTVTAADIVLWIHLHLDDILGVVTDIVMVLRQHQAVLHRLQLRDRLLLDDLSEIVVWIRSRHVGRRRASHGHKPR
mmetsp:Transcript_27400/g.43358  ORF Transcript_27400/g.43358 Transcript_27400/m.43358 type:complete len:268 (+) Transcript_27400:1248-2051(+)